MSAIKKKIKSASPNHSLKSTQKNTLPLFWKFMIAMVGIVVIFGSVNMLMVKHAVYETFESEIEKRGYFIAKSIAERSVAPLLYDDIALLYELLEDVKQIDPSVAYAFIINEKYEVVAKTTDFIIPRNLLVANIPQYDSDRNSIIIQDKKDKNNITRDIAVPILNGQAGYVRIGLEEASYKQEINIVRNQFMVMISLFLICGITGTFIFSYIITKPVKYISQIAEKFNLNQGENEMDASLEKLSEIPMLKFKNLFNLKDEIDVLTSKFTDMINRLKSTYTELQTTQASLVQSEKMATVGTLVAGICHEINNPLAGLQNCIRRINKNPHNIVQNTKYLDLMNDAVNKIEYILNGLLDFSRKREYDYKPVIIQNVIKNVVALVSYKLEKSGIKFVHKIPKEDYSVMGNSNQLEQVVLNLVINSIDSINEKQLADSRLKGTIIIMLNENKSRIDLIISDNGIGIPEDKLKYIFDPFFTMKKVREGTGLGLSIAYKIVQDHKGQINAHNNVDGGMDFQISLPKPEYS